jgi:acyl-CoA synthetase
VITVPRERIDAYVRRGWWGERMLGEIFIDTALRQPDTPAVLDAPNRMQLCDSEPLRWTWGELLCETGRMAAWLHARGLRKDDILVVQLPNIVEMHALYLACAVSGIVISPVPVQYRAHELSHVFETTGARAGLTLERIGHHRSAQYWREHAGRMPTCEQVLTLPDRDASVPAWSAQAMRAHMRDIGLSAHDVLTLCWTSGTEARAKGVPRNHNEWLLVGQSVIDAGALRTGAQLLIPFPFVNMAGVSTSLVAWLLAGATLHHHHPFDLDVFIGQLRDHPIDYTVVAPAVLGMLLKNPDCLRGVDLSRLKRVGSGGGPLAAWMVAQCASQLGIEVVNYFGSNEGAALSSTPQDVPDPAQRAAYFPRMGVPGYDWSLSNSRKIRTRLVDLDTGDEITESGRLGELRFAGPTIFSGYFNAPEASARAFDEHGYYRSGDLFEIAGDRQQFYRYAGRHKDIVIRGGMNISCEEVEGLLGSHPQVREVAVVGAPDAVFGERLCAMVVPQGGEPTLESLVGFLREEHGVAAFKLPERLVLLDELPRNPLGKVLKRELRAMLAQAAGADA